MTLAPKDPDVPAEYGIDFHDELVFVAERRTDFPLTTILYFPRDTGWYYEVTTAGKTGMAYPDQLPRASGETVTDGSCVLTCRHPSSSSLPTLSSVTWTVPTGLTLDSQRTSGRTAYVTLSGGSDGEDYEVLCRATPSAGNVLEKTITVEVRAQ